MPVAKEQIRQIISENNITSVADVYSLLRDSFKDILQELMEAEMDATLGYFSICLGDENRRLRDVLFFCVDGLAGFKEAISAVYPDAQIQRCVIHMLRNSFKYVNYQDLKKFSSDFKAVYNAPTEAAALSELEAVRDRWGKKYPYAISSWEKNWEDVSSFFQFSDDIRRIMYTTYADKKTIPTFPRIAVTTMPF